MALSLGAHNSFSIIPAFICVLFNRRHKHRCHPLFAQLSSKHSSVLSCGLASDTKSCALVVWFGVNYWKVRTSMRKAKLRALTIRANYGNTETGTQPYQFWLLRLSQAWLSKTHAQSRSRDSASLCSCSAGGRAVYDCVLFIVGSAILGKTVRSQRGRQFEVKCLCDRTCLLCALVATTTSTTAQPTTPSSVKTCEM